MVQASTAPSARHAKGASLQRQVPTVCMHSGIVACVCCGVRNSLLIFAFTTHVLACQQRNFTQLLVYDLAEPRPRRHNRAALALRSAQ
eukprot:SAG11_NODE_2841_length_2917_cov_2.825701_2_plen_88_part_00